MIEKDLLINATENLIEQQFYKHGTDTIIGRTPEISIKIKQSGIVIKKFKELFNENLASFLKAQYLEFFEPFTVIKGIDQNHIKEIYQDIQIRLAAMHDTEIDPVIMYTIVLGSLISKIRNLHFNASVAEIKNRTILKKKILSKERINQELDKLFMKNDKNISIIYNLAYLDALAESFNFRRVAHTCKIQKSKYINRVVKIILSSIN